MLDTFSSSRVFREKKAKQDWSFILSLILSSLTFYHHFDHILSYRTPIEVISYCIEKLIQRSTIIISTSKANSNYSDHYGTWKCVKDISAVRQTRYSAICHAIAHSYCRLGHFYLRYSPKLTAHTLFWTSQHLHYSASLTTEINGLGPNFEKRDSRTIKGKQLESKNTFWHIYTHSRSEERQP